MLIRERNLPSAVCSSCEIQTPGPHWHCRPCMFDVCIGCGEQQGYISPATSAKCKNKHLLSTTYTNESVPCLMCKNIFSGNCYLCVDCKYVICEDCQNYLKCPAPGHPIVRCPEKHLLRWYQEDSFICDGCGQRKIEERFSCIECEYDMCADCSSYLIDSVSKTGTRCCQKRHKLLWCFETNALYSGQPYNCGVCNRKYKRIGSYRCNECELDICFKCMAKQT